MIAIVGSERWVSERVVANTQVIPDPRRQAPPTRIYFPALHGNAPANASEAM